MPTQKKVPNHVAIIPDGQRRWAKRHHKWRITAYRKGMNRIKEIGEYLYNIGVNEFTVYGLSWDNFHKRDKKDLNLVLRVIKKGLIDYLESDVDVNVKFAFRPLGFWWKLPFANLIRDVKLRTEHNEKKFNLCLNYSFQRYKVPKKYGISNIDLLIRTGGYPRLSCFMLDRIDYATFLVSKKLFPDFTVNDVRKMIARWRNEKQNYGH